MPSYFSRAAAPAAPLICTGDHAQVRAQIDGYRAAFEHLIQVDGVGPKVGLAILSVASVEVLKRAILQEDVGPIRRAPGVGPRTAQKVIIDLKPRLEAEAAMLAVPRAAAAAGDGEVPRAVETALRGLGFSARRFCDRVET